MTAETAEKKARERSRHAAPKTSSSNLFWRIAASLLFLTAAALGALLFLAKEGLIFRPEVVEEEPVRATAYCYYAEGKALEVSAELGQSAVLPEGPALDGYTFIGWSDAQGVLQKSGEVTLFEDCAYAAVYQIAFRDLGQSGSHEPYFPLDEDMLFHPNAPLSRGRAIELLYAFLQTEGVGSGRFADVSEDDACYRAAATLKDLGVIGGSRLHPDEPITCEELFEILAHFFPASGNDYAFTAIPPDDVRYGAFCLAMDKGWISDPDIDPGRDLTKGECAHIFNALTGRGMTAQSDYALVGTIYDVSFSDPYFWDIAESCIPHEAQRGEDGEHWLSSSPLPLREEGFFFVGTALHCAGSNGSALVNESYGSFDFGPDGVITTGMPELDALVQAKLQELELDPATMERDYMLRRCYDNVTYHNAYLSVKHYEVGDISWVNDEAYHMLTVRKGNCYNFSAEFYVLARALGYDAVIYSGTVNLKNPHAWVEIEFDGVPYVFDTELEYTQHIMAHSTACYFKLPYERVKGWYYFRG